MGRLDMLPQVLEIISAGALVFGFVMVTAVWLSSAVENTSDFFVGIVVFRSINTV